MELENDIDDLVEYFNHTNKLMNIYKWILFTCKTKEEFLEKIKLSQNQMELK